MESLRLQDRGICGKKKIDKRRRQKPHPIDGWGDGCDQWSQVAQEEQPSSSPSGTSFLT